ncbi:alginate lyase family protein [Martelella radicis]|uniref:Poly(Beta-D-mannuronate) lyase n=1 Tax=Martelella radicis TaxID=1397476 RepID=A0A7W6P946_9HYPH|nr:alginate lyase family protein [Martelella radicis]MBB4121420.1 poly(beta-D-mannuronate) lyase [Martelella radicis]
MTEFANDQKQAEFRRRASRRQRWRTGRVSRALLLAGAAVILGAAAEPPAPDADGEACPAFPPPTVTLDYGSRYEESSSDRSELDAAGNAEVDQALKDADEFIRLLDGLANDVLVNPVLARTRADCVISGIADWANAGAFSALETENARMTYASRVGGIASAYRQVRDKTENLSEEKTAIEAWLRKNADFLTDYWSNDAPPKAKMGNLRLWAAYAVTEVALIVREPEYINWALDSHRTILATEDENGSLPYEMRRGAYALHYQLHALAPLVASAALICHNDYAYSKEEQAAIENAVTFALDGIADPNEVALIAGKPQTVKQGLNDQEPFSIAFLEAYLSLVTDATLDRKLAPLRPLSNSKLGGDLTLIFRNNPAMQPGCFTPKVPKDG